MYAIRGLYLWLAFGGVVLICCSIIITRTYFYSFLFFIFFFFFIYLLIYLFSRSFLFSPSPFRDMELWNLIGGLVNQELLLHSPQMSRPG
ncbi:hypothetical protein BDV41DRAFT_554910 [Aspergillus transmontanensis]|uniref:Uncharacterized protein n=1 Tax=Aspergillus transmontanensis TaxID=1034304 RepID=A0A5N6VG40_9EURO|nr:hypothetical protein BDV41DRAFT_554910 [Aspergillus transmontanensis]